MRFGQEFVCKLFLLELPHGLDSVSYLAPKIWNLVPNEIKRCKTLNSFRHSIKNWKPTACPCKFYISNVGFI